MARGVNKAILVGDVIDDLKATQFKSGDSVCHFTLGTTSNWIDARTNQHKQATEYHKVVMYSRLAESALERLKKGMRVYLEGSVRTRSYEDKSGAKRYITEIHATEFETFVVPRETVEEHHLQEQQTQMAQDDWDDADIPF